MKNTILSRRQTATTVLTSIFTRKLPFLLALAALLALQPNLRAGVQYWDPDGNGLNNDCTTGAGLGGASGNWEAPPFSWTPDGNCTGATTSWTEGNDAVLWGLTGAGNLYTLGLNTPHTVNSLSIYCTMSGTAFNTNYIISGTGGNNLTNITGKITLDGGASPDGGSAGNITAVISVPLAGTNGLTKLGDGLLWLNAVATYSGPTVISGLLPPATGGAIEMLVVNGIPANSPVTLINGGVLNINNRNQTVGPVVITNGYITGGGVLTAPSYEVQLLRNGNNAINATLGGATSPLLKTTTNYVVISSANTYGGGTTIRSGSIGWRNNGAMGASTVTLNDAYTGSDATGLVRDRLGTVNGSTTVLGNDIIVANQGSGTVTIGNLNYIATAFTITYNGNVTLNRSAVLTAPAGGNGVLFNGSFSGPGGLTIAGGGVVFLTSANTFGGEVDLNAGLLKAYNISVLSGGPLVFNGGGLQFGGGYDPSTLTMTFNSGGAILDTLGNTVTLANPIGNHGSGSLTESGTAGLLQLGAVNTYTGGTIVSVGTLEAQADGSLGSGNVSVASGATLQLDTTAGIASSANLILSGTSPSVSLSFTGTSTINALSFDGGVTFVNSGTWGAVGSTAVNQDGRFTGSGVLQITKSGATTTLTSSLNPAYYGSSVTFTATVASVSTGTPSGTVTFKDGATVLGTGALTAGQTTFTTNNLSVSGSPHAITAAYGGDASFVQSTSAALSQVISPNCSHTNAVLAITNNLNGTFKLTVVGTPGAYYYVVAQTNVTQPLANWAVVAGSTNVVTDFSGVWYFTATNAAPQYYRVAAVTVCP